MSEAKKLKEVSVPNIPSFQMLELAPTKVMFADSSGILNYLNKASQDTLKVLEQYLPDKVENLVGKSFDWFHKNPEIQKKIISSPENLPHRAIIQLGPEQLDLLVSAVMDENNNYIGPMVCWEVVTEKLKIEAEAVRASNMVELSPINTMLADRDGNLLYMNHNSKATLETLEQYLPDKVNNLVGKSIDWFHKNPEHQRKIIGDPSNLPHRAIIQLGPEKLDLLVSPIMDNDKNYIGPMVTWEVVTEKLRLEEEQARSECMVEKSALNTMMCNPDGDIVTINEASRNTLRTLEQYLPVKVNEIAGQKIDIF
ncbi:MAG: hypothetical protein NXH75_08230, partial [Halobacteriovoraceae bacterium]|nr:hypothetical protein [Halobacteriovoraceae bacterium]